MSDTKDNKTPSPFDQLQPQKAHGDTAESIAMSLPLKVEVVVGEKLLTVEEIFNLKQGNIVELNKTSSDPANIVVNGTIIGTGELTVLEDGRIGVTLIDIKRGSK